MRVAIDGPAGSGKSTVAHAIAKRCNLTFLDTGAMYRSVAFRCLADGIGLDDTADVVSVAQNATIEFGASPDGGQTVRIDGVDVTRQIRTPEVDRAVACVAGIHEVREAMVARQRELGAAGDVVAEGRDIGSVVFPGAEVKVFLTANAEARAHRRAVQRVGGDAGTGRDVKTDAAEEKKILEDMARRDEQDSSRKEFELKPVADAHVIDSSALTLDEVVAQVEALVEAARKPLASTPPKAPEAPKASDKPATAKPAGSAAGKAEGRMHAFGGNSLDDYYDHAMADYPLPARALKTVLFAIVGFLTKLFWPWKIEDGHKLWDNKSGRVIVMNHVSMLEPIIVIVTLWFRGIHVRPVYKSEFDKVGVASWLFSRVGAIPVKRGTADMKALRRAERALKRGECVLIYPEGTRVRTDEPAQIHGGFALMAQMGKAEVQPMAVVGARDIRIRDTQLRRPKRVWCKVGDCIGFGDLGVKGRKAQAKEMERLAAERMYELRDELRHEHPGQW